MKEGINELKMGQGEVWKTLTLGWRSIDQITLAMGIVKAMCEFRRDTDESIVRVNKDFVVRITQDGLSISFSDWNENEELDELIEATKNGEDTSKKDKIRLCDGSDACRNFFPEGVGGLQSKVEAYTKSGEFGDSPSHAKKPKEVKDEPIERED